MAVTKIVGQVVNDAAGAAVGVMGANGTEYLFGAIPNGPAVAAPAALNAAGTPIVATTLSASGAVTLSPANANVTLSPTGTGIVAIAPATAGTVNNMSIGVTTPAVVRTSNMQATFTDSSGTPGAVTNNSPRGRVAFAAAAASVVVTNSLVTAASMVIAQLRSPDGALTFLMACISAAGSFTITGNAVSTGTAAQVDFFVVN